MNYLVIKGRTVCSLNDEELSYLCQELPEGYNLYSFTDLDNKPLNFLVI